jgi:hypothetical protein
MKFPFTYLLLCLAIAGCHAGTQIENFEQARRPEGITVRIETRGGIAERVEGELLEVREGGLLLITREAQEGGGVKRHLVLVPYTAMENVRAEKLNLSVLNEFDPWDEEDVWAEGDAPPKSRERDREKLRLLSRFPQGLSRPLLEDLLEAEGQTTIDVIDGE